MNCRFLFYTLLSLITISLFTTCSDDEHQMVFEKIITSEPTLVENGEIIQFVDSTVLKLNIEEEKVSGEFDWNTSNTERISGKLIGTIHDNVINAICSYEQGGSLIREEKVIKLGKNFAHFRIGGKMKLQDGVYLYSSNDENVEYGAKIPRKF
ncbi:hypothetical protein MY04_1958 [Flammeovirga sp. MY04]|uniref:hypothetical protein n=1 Tax=Flammeovirga sp. MY04 TaxID=1191459 RepID=UPI000826F279|nr:hypothetical protein [Flammeovirga sp. MY04]ANQ49332.2 hypothetical protein MY04_1958 [Flammeovirga sp. MY04]